MGTALGILVDVLLGAAIWGLFGTGSIGLVRAASRTARKRGWRTGRRALFISAAVLGAFLGGWLVFVLLWPFRRLRQTRTSGLQRRTLYVAAGLSILVPCGFVVAAIASVPCSFDPPPGDQLTLTIVNDTQAAVTVVDCIDDDACAEAWNPTPVAAGRRASMLLEGCQGGTMGVLAAGTGRLQSCIAEPTEDGDGNLRTVTVSKGRPCAHGRTGARVHVVDPGG